MERSIATGPDLPPSIAAARPTLSTRSRDLLERTDPARVGILLLLFATVVYVLSNPERQNFYNHFVWQADAYLHGRVAIPFPFDDGRFSNAYFQDVLPLVEDPGFALIPFPPLPAIVLLPFVALFGLATNAAFVATFIGALGVALAWRLTLRLTDRRDAALLATLFYGFGTVAWYAAMLGSTWFLAHVVANLFIFLALTAAIDAERHWAITRSRGWGWSFGWVDTRQFVAGLFLGIAGLARLPVVFGAPFFMLVGGGGSWWRRSFSAGLGAVIPVALLIGYNVATTGHVFHPAYEYLYQTEYSPRPEFIHYGEWAIEDIRYVPQNAMIMLAWPPEILPQANCAPSLLDPACPIVRPDPFAMSLLLTSPAYLLAIPMLWSWRRRIVAGAALATGAIALLNLMHFSQGWVQFGYRFSNDFAPYLLILVTLGIARFGVRPLTIGLVAASILINAWGVYWGVTLGW